MKEIDKKVLDQENLDGVQPPHKVVSVGLDNSCPITNADIHNYGISPAKFYNLWPGNPDYLKPPLSLADAFHLYFTQGQDEFKNKYVFKPPKLDLRTKDGKAFKADYENRGLSLGPSYELFKAIDTAFRSCPPLDNDLHKLIPHQLPSFFFYAKNKPSLRLSPPNCLLLSPPNLPDLFPVEMQSQKIIVDYRLSSSCSRSHFNNLCLFSGLALKLAYIHFFSEPHHLLLDSNGEPLTLTANLIQSVISDLESSSPAIKPPETLPMMLLQEKKAPHLLAFHTLSLEALTSAKLLLLDILNRLIISFPSPSCPPSPDFFTSYLPFVNPSSFPCPAPLSTFYNTKR